MASKLDKYGLDGMTAKQKRAAAMLADPTFTGTISDLCEEIGVARSTFYNWMESAVFRAYVEKLIDLYTDAELSRAWKALMKLVDRGEFQAIKLFFELKGKYKTGVAISGNDKLDSLIDAIREVN